MNEYVTIKEIAQAKGLKSTRSIRMEINKPESKYISREVKVNGGISYEILFSSLEPELQQKLRECETKSTAIVPLNYLSETILNCFFGRVVNLMIYATSLPLVNMPQAYLLGRVCTTPSLRCWRVYEPYISGCPRVQARSHSDIT